MEDVATKMTIHNNHKLTQSQIRSFCNALVDVAMPIIEKNGEELHMLNSHQVIHAEVTRKLFKQMINVIETMSKTILEEFVEKSMIEYKHDPKSKKNVMVARTKVLESTVEFFNRLNDIVIRYYDDVYYIWDGKQEPMDKQDKTEPTQTTLF